MVADDPVRRNGRHAVAGRVLSRLPDQPRDRYPDNRPSSPRERGKPCARAAMRVVSGLRADAGASWVACDDAPSRPEAIRRLLAKALGGARTGKK